MPQADRVRHVPERMCIICRSRESKRVLSRLVRTGHGVVVDLTGKENGRGAYLCRSRECWERAFSTDVLSRALRTTLTDDDRERLKQAMPTA